MACTPFLLRCWQGLSTDDKPVARDGDVFVEIDTGRILHQISGIWEETSSKENGLPIYVAAHDSSLVARNRADFVCDGISDQVQIQAAIDALPYMPTWGTHQGKVQLLEGNYYISAPVVMDKGANEPWGVWLAGFGQNITNIRLADNSNCNMIELVTRGYDVQGWKYITDMSLYGNQVNQTSGHGIYQTDEGGGGHWDKYFINVYVDDCKENGFHITRSWGQRIINCLSENHGGTGLYFKSSQGYVSNFFSYSNNGGGIYINGAISLSGFQIRESGSSGLWASDLVQVTNGHIQTWNKSAGTNHGMYVAGVGGHFNNITIDGYGNIDASRGVFFNRPQEFSLLGCTVKGCTQWPIRIAENSKNGTIVGNILEAGNIGVVFYQNYMGINCEVGLNVLI